MRLSGFHMPGWWQALWRRRYPMGVDGRLDVLVHGPVGQWWFEIRPMPCGCGYCVYHDHSRIGAHRPTLGGAIRQARRYARSDGAAREPQL